MEQHHGNPTFDWHERGPGLWAALHTWSLGADLATAARWLSMFELKIACGECLTHWREWVGKHPPDMTSTESLFLWTVAAHNAVNHRLGKPQWTPEQAIARWRGATAVLPDPEGAPSSDMKAALLSVDDSVPVNCRAAGKGPRPTAVHCNLGLFGGTPHIALCKGCTRRTPRDPAAPAITAPASPIFPSPAESPAGQDPSRLLLRCKLSPGDILMLTAAVRDLHRAHPGRFVTAVETPVPELWEHNPHVWPADRSSGQWREIETHYPLIQQSNQRPVHFIQGYCDFLAHELDLPIPVTEFRGDVHLTEEEKGWMNQLREHFGYAGNFWIIMAGGKYDMTAKWWPPSFYQKVVDHFIGRVQFVQCGQAGHWHPPLKGVFNLIGRTSVRQFIRLMYHADGVICPVTFAMHLSAAVPTRTGRLRPCIVIAGGREPPQWEAYPGHQFLHTIGCLPCCGTGGCWRSRCQRVGDGDPKDADGLCERPVQIDPDLRVPQCMTLVRPEDVIRAVERSLSYAA